MSDPARLPPGIRRAGLGPLTGILVTLAALPLMGGLFIAGMARGCGPGFGEALAKAIPTCWFRDDRTADLEIAAGEPGYLASLRFAGPQFHFRDGEHRTCVAARIWHGDRSERVTVATYDGPPSRDLAPESVRAWPLPGLLVLRVVGADGRPREGARVWSRLPGIDRPLGPAVAEHGALNLAHLIGGKVTVWTDDGPACEIEMRPLERVSATLGPEGLVIDAREGR